MGKVTDEPPSDEAEGHAWRGKYGSEGTDEPPSDDTQGNAMRGRPFTPDAERPAQPGEQQAHPGEREMYRPGRVTDESDTEG